MLLTYKLKISYLQSYKNVHASFEVAVCNNKNLNKLHVKKRINYVESICSGRTATLRTSSPLTRASHNWHCQMPEILQNYEKSDLLFL